MKSTEQIINYFKERNLYDVLEANFIAYRGTSLIDMIITTIASGSAPRLICGYFKWDASPQGYVFWSYIDHEYQQWFFS